MKLLVQFLLLTVLTAPTLCDVSVSEGNSSPQVFSRRYQIFHAFRFDDVNDVDPFQPRGHIILSTSSESNGLNLTVVEEPECIASSIEDFNHLVKTGGMYRIKLVDEENPQFSVMTSTPSCEVRRSNFREEIALSLSPTGTVLSISYQPIVSKLVPPCQDYPPLQPSADFKFKTTVTYSTAETAMNIPLVLPQLRPPHGLKWFPRTSNGKTGEGPNRGDDAAKVILPSATGNSPFVDPTEEATNQQQQKSFLQRYWYIIVPMFVVLLSGGGDDSQQQKQRPVSQDASQSSHANVIQSPKSTASNMSSHAAAMDSAKPRRGKRNQ